VNNKVKLVFAGRAEGHRIAIKDRIGRVEALWMAEGSSVGW